MKSILRTSVNWLPHGVRHRIRHIPGIAALQRWLVNRVLSGEPFVHTINAGPAAGLQFEVTLPLDKAIWAGTYESDFADAISRGVKGGDVCYDVGGYRGYMSGTMALAGASRVLTFEPLPANQQALQRLCDLNPGLNIELKPIAVGNTDGSIQLRVMADASMGKLITSTFQSGAPTAGVIEVAIRRLDSMVQAGEIPPPRLIKIDVEGAELEVLRGAADVLTANRPLVFLEAHSGALEEACSQVLARHGYTIRRLELSSRGEEQTRHLIAFPQ
jgi:FkbM family methyltransferase